jgi:hypothetical protein
MSTRPPLSSKVVDVLSRLGLPVPPEGQVLTVAAVDQALANHGASIAQRMLVKGTFAQLRIINP